MGGKLEEIRRLREKLSSGQLSPEEAVNEQRLIKTRIVGTLLKDARTGSARSTTDAASLLQIAEEEYVKFEQGSKSPTLPQLEVLAYFYNVPIGHFWSGETLSVKRNETNIQERLPEVMMLRQRIIGVQFQQLREQAKMSVDEVATGSGIDSTIIDDFEAGEIAISISELESLARTVRTTIDAVMAHHGPVGSWIKAQSEFETFADLPADIREFILKPINRSYLELAVRLSRMEVDKLRIIAESILDITL